MIYWRRKMYYKFLRRDCARFSWNQLHAFYRDWDKIDSYCDEVKSKINCDIISLIQVVINNNPTQTNDLTVTRLGHLAESNCIKLFEKKKTKYNQLENNNASKSPPLFYAMISNKLSTKNTKPIKINLFDLLEFKNSTSQIGIWWRITSIS